MHQSLHRPLASALVVAACIAAGCGVSSASPVGLWLAQDGARIRISPCGHYLCGVLVQAAEAGATDRNNPDPARRGRPLAGIEVLISMHRDAPDKWTGHVYNLDDGRIYEGHLIENNEAKIRIEGCWLGMCGGEDLRRLR
jgi:uncharacterized protein (DUF2147 family)